VSSEQSQRQSLLAALEQAMRKSSAQGVLFSQAVAARLGISSSDLECLDIILMHERITAGELAAATGLTTGAVTGVIDRLEKAGFARRERDSKDRRKVFVFALPSVGERIGPFYRSLQQASAAMLAAYSDRELEFLLDFFTRAGEMMTGETARLRDA
jgi:DNA-binding MarR family transcriptional regulator